VDRRLSARIRRSASMPSTFGIITSITTSVGTVLERELERLGAVARLHDLVAVRARG
jgi:hypothetical protein